MDIPFAHRSSFLEACEAAIREGKVELDADGGVCIKLGNGGYPGRILITVRAGDNAAFGTDWEGTDTTRFPARIKAAATALLNCGCVERDNPEPASVHE